MLSLLEKPFNEGFRETSATGMGGDCGRDLMGETTTSGLDTTSLGRDRERERDLRYGRTFGTCRYCELVPAMVYDRDGRAQRRPDETREEDNIIVKKDAAVVLYPRKRTETRESLFPTGGSVRSQLSLRRSMDGGRCGRRYTSPTVSRLHETPKAKGSVRTLGKNQ